MRSSLRLTPRNSASAARLCSTGTPACRAATSAASAFNRVWRPNCVASAGQRTCPCGAPACVTLPSARDPPLRAAARSRAPSSAPAKRSTDDQQPRASTRARLASSALTISAPVRRDRAHQVMELRLDRGQVREDVGVVVLEVVEDQRARPVVHELRALVEERGVVLVGLDHEEAAVGMARRHAEIQRHAADQEAGREPGVVEDPREHRRRARLAVRAGDREHEPVREHVIAQPLGSGRVREAAVEHRLDQRIAARDDVADDEQIGVRRHAFELRRIVAFGQRDARALQAAWTSADRRSRRSR